MAAGKSIGADGKINGMIRVREAMGEVREGATFGTWTALGPPFHANERWYVVCECRCGRVETVRTRSLKRKLCASCSRKVHGQEPKILYLKWKNMLSRCRNPRNASYGNYGARGIAVCAEWLPECRLDIDRIDVNGNYEPSNCRFVDQETQMNNRTNSVYLTAFGETKTAAQWGRDSRARADCDTISDRKRCGWPDEDAITTLSDERWKEYEAFGKRMTLRQWSRDPICVVKYSCLCYRVLKWSWPIEKALTTPSRKQTKVTDELRKRIYELASKMPQREISRLTGVSIGHVSTIISRKPKSPQ